MTDQREEKAAEGVTYTKPAAQLDLERRLADDYVSPHVLAKGQNPSETGAYTPDDEGYVGTNEEYKNHANDTEAPLAAEGGADKLAEEAHTAAAEAGPVLDGPVQTRLATEVKQAEDGPKTVFQEALVSDTTPSDAEKKDETTPATPAPVTPTPVVTPPATQ